MLFLALRPLPVPSLVLFALLTSVSAKIDKADELSRCEQDGDIFSLIQSDKSRQNFADSNANIATSAMVGSNHVQPLLDTTANVGASLSTKESGQSLVQRVMKYTSNNYQSTMAGSGQVLIPLALGLMVIALLVCLAVSVRRVNTEEPRDMASMIAKIRGSPTPNKNTGGSQARTPFVGSSTSPPDSFTHEASLRPYVSPSAMQYNREPLHHFSPRGGQRTAESLRPFTSSPQMPLARSSMEAIASAVDASLVRTTAETRPGAQHGTPTFQGSPRQSEFPLASKKSSPSPLVPSLLTTSGETRIGVHFLSLGDADKDKVVDIIYPTGKPCVRMNILGDDQHGWTLVISTVQPNQRACTIVNPPASEPEKPYLILNGQGVEHGFFRCVGTHLFEAVIRGMSVYMIQGNADNQQYQVIENSRTVALAHLNKTDFPGGEHLEFRILPGADTVLVVAIVLAITVFCETA